MLFRSTQYTPQGAGGSWAVSGGHAIEKLVALNKALVSVVEQMYQTQVRK